LIGKEVEKIEYYNYLMKILNSLREEIRPNNKELPSAAEK
jgi:hypothetical protein